MGIGLRARSNSDLHVVVHHLVEDDGNWFEPHTASFDSYWTADLLSQVQAAIVWMEANCDRDGAFGYKFRC
jgi:hypothetical protein